MSHYSILPPDPGREELPDEQTEVLRGLIEETAPADVDRLVQTLAANGGGDLSSDLALDLLLNETVAQAGLATGASGAAIALLKDGELVCRATTGTTAPDLGTRLETRYGLSGTCIQTGTVQHCGDAEADPRVGAFASRQLGVRSILVVPLLEDGQTQGVFEIFSPRPHAFSERDAQTLEALSRRILQDRRRAARSILGSVGEARKPEPPSQPVSSPALKVPTFGVEVQAPRRRPSGNIDLVTGTLAGAVIVAAVGLGLLIGWRSGLGTSPASPRRPQSQVALPATPTQPVASGSFAVPKISGSSPVAAISAPKDGSSSKSPSQGGLVVYENGRVVYRMAPGDVTQRKPLASAQENLSDIVTLPSPDAESRLLHRVDAEFPLEASSKRLQGAVVLDTTVAADGNVESVELVSGDPVFSTNAMNAVRQWRYRPLVAAGQNIPFRTRVTITFSLAAK